jgi:hypothetical protein
MVEAGVSPAPCLLGEGRWVLPSATGAMGNPSVESIVIVRRRGSGPPRAEPMAMASEPSPMGERLRPPRQTVMN